jgi:hypothetical protein
MPQSTVTATATAGKAVAHGEAAIITTEALVTAAGSSYVLTLGNNQIKSDSVVLPIIYNGTNTQGDPSLATLAISLGKVVINIANRHASQALNGTLQIGLLIR